MSNLIASTAPRARQLTHEEIHEIEHEKTHYPYPQAVGLEALKIVQKYQGWVSDESLLAVAAYLQIPPDDLEGVATFFNLIYRRPVGKNVILFCDSVACWMLGCDSLKAHITKTLGIEYGQTTTDNLFTLIPVPCLGDCDKAPTMMVGNESYRNLTPTSIDQIIADHKAKA
ncbi:MAG: NADH-quinone oxidoreductase subunit NuoE [Pseudohongiellaceae bacterium]|jgi:NADH-quinone oxidoreductase subunit E